MPYTYNYPRPAVTTDCLVFRQSDGKTELLLIQRGQPPFKGMWALPGGFMEMDETLEESAARELKEESGLSNINLKQFRAYSGLDRDPRQRTIGVVFFGFVDVHAKAKAGDDAAKTQWFPVDDLPELAFDHPLICKEAIAELLD